MNAEWQEDSSRIVIRHHGAEEVPALVDATADVWADAHPELVGLAETAGDGFFVEKYKRQIIGHLKHPGFTLAVALGDGAMAGFGYAFPCTPEYWFGPDLLPSIPEEARSGARLMGLCELAVRPGWQSRGIGSRLHSELIKTIAPEWSSLLVRPSNQRGRSLYERLGYRYAGPYRNTADGLTFDLLLLRVGLRGRHLSEGRRVARLSPPVER